MPGLAFLNKKGFHTTNLKNVERVWIAEQKHAAEQKKLAELQKQLEEERQILELRQLQASSGQSAAKTIDNSLDWMYEGPMSGAASQAQQESSEEFLLGKIYKSDGKGASGIDSSSTVAGGLGVGGPGSTAWLSKIASSKNDSFTRTHEDPFILIKQQENKARETILNNPLKMDKIRQRISAELHGRDDSHRRRKEAKKEKKEKKEKKLSKKLEKKEKKAARRAAKSGESVKVEDKKVKDGSSSSDESGNESDVGAADDDAPACSSDVEGRVRDTDASTQGTKRSAAETTRGADTSARRGGDSSGEAARDDSGDRSFAERTAKRPRARSRSPAAHREHGKHKHGSSERDSRDRDWDGHRDSSRDRDRDRDRARSRDRERGGNNDSGRDGDLSMDRGAARDRDIDRNRVRGRDGTTRRGQQDYATAGSDQRRRVDSRDRDGGRKRDRDRDIGRGEEHKAENHEDARRHGRESPARISASTCRTSSIRDNARSINHSSKPSEEAKSEQGSGDEPDEERIEELAPVVAAEKRYGLINKSIPREGSGGSCSGVGEGEKSIGISSGRRALGPNPELLRKKAEQQRAEEAERRRKLQGTGSVRGGSGLSAVEREQRLKEMEIDACQVDAARLARLHGDGEAARGDSEGDAAAAVRAVSGGDGAYTGNAQFLSDMRREVYVGTAGAEGTEGRALDMRSRIDRNKHYRQSKADLDSAEGFLAKSK